MGAGVTLAANPKIKKIPSFFQGGVGVVKKTTKNTP
jgi:hypothetical protein